MTSIKSLDDHTTPFRMLIPLVIGKIMILTDTWFHARKIKAPIVFDQLFCYFCIPVFCFYAVSISCGVRNARMWTLGERCMSVTYEGMTISMSENLVSTKGRDVSFLATGIFATQKSLSSFGAFFAFWNIDIIKHVGHHGNCFSSYLRPLGVQRVLGQLRILVAG